MCIRDSNETQIEPPRRSLTNRLSFGLFDKPETKQSSEEDAAN